MTNLKPEVVIDQKSLLGEGPVWDSRNGIICWIDILNGQIHQYSPSDMRYSAIAVGQMIGSFAISTNGDFITALQHGFAFVSRDGSNIRFVHDPELHLPGNRFNDGKCDPQGRFWAGTMSLAEETGAGSLYMLDKNLSVATRHSNVTISNGLAWTKDHKTLYYIDTPTSTVFSFDYDKQTGEIANKKPVIRFESKEGYPDGMTIDAEDMLWISHWDGWQVSRWNPKTGEKLLSVPMPAARVTSCTFGGPNLDDLYITTARKELTDEQLSKQPLAGSLFVIKNCGYRGMRANEFSAE